MHLEYSAYKPIDGRIWPSPVALGADVDSGYLIALETARGLEVDVVKCLRFIELAFAGPAAHLAPVSSLVNRSLPALLGVWLRQVMDNPAVIGGTPRRR